MSCQEKLQTPKNSGFINRLKINEKTISGLWTIETMCDSGLEDQVITAGFPLENLAKLIDKRGSSADRRAVVHRAKKQDGKSRRFLFIYFLLLLQQPYHR